MNLFDFSIGYALGALFVFLIAITLAYAKMKHDETASEIEVLNMKVEKIREVVLSMVEKEEKKWN